MVLKKSSKHFRILKGSYDAEVEKVTVNEFWSAEGKYERTV